MTSVAAEMTWLFPFSFPLQAAEEVLQLACPEVFILNSNKNVLEFLLESILKFFYLMRPRT